MRVRSTSAAIFGVFLPSLLGLTSPFWPQPQEYSVGTTTLVLDGSFHFLLSEQSSSSEFLSQAIARYERLIASSFSTSVSEKTTNTVKSCLVNVVTLNEDEYPTLQMDVDESYSLIITDDSICQINSQTVWGALHAFETFTQLLSRDLNDGSIYTTFAPVTVSDTSRFTHRGILIDTSRHYIPVDALKSFIDTLPMSKFNALHWHMVDAQSFPVDTPTAPNLIQGAFTPSHIYSLNDVEMLTQYAADRGVRILAEIDIPGHAASWKNGYPEIMADCFEKYYYNINNFALDPTKDETYNIVESVLKDLVDSMNDHYLHLGGDEVVYGCWSNDTNIVEFMASKGWTSYNQLLEYFVLKVDDILRSKGSIPVHWEEVFKAGAKVDSDVIFEVWTSQDQIKSVVQSKYRVIAAPSDVWYLDFPENTWSVMYSYDPVTNLTSSEASYIIGGEVAMWGEHVDENNLQSIVYPRAASVGERLWSPSTVIDQDDALSRLSIHRCRMISRGIKPGAIQPGYCSLTTIPV